ncbi:MAG: hypothetical protein V1866_02655 [archaeon]
MNETLGTDEPARDVMRARARAGSFSRRAQLEMIGIIVIVIIVMTVLMIYLVYKINNPVKDVRTVYINGEIATNLLITFTKTNIAECHDIALSELITDCAKEYHSITCFGRSSCEMVNTSLHGLVNVTLVEWNARFRLAVGGTDIEIMNDFCGVKAKKIRGFTVLPLNPGQSEITLDICN